MKKLNLLFIGVLSMSYVSAQDISDAVRYSLDEVQGTARFRAMGGAFGALGGDLSAISINPAGAAIFTRSNGSFSISNLNTKNDVNYFNGFSSSSDSKFDVNQLGAVFVFNNTDQNSPWKKLALSVNYDKLSNFDNHWYAVGTGNTSIDRYFLDRTEVREIPFGVLKLLPDEFLEEAYADIGANPNYGYDFQQVFLGYWAGIIDPLNPDDNTNDNNIDYISNTAPATSFNQDYYYASTGYNGKLTFNIASQYGDNVYMGLNLNSHFVNYEKFTSFIETNDNPNSYANDILFENQLRTNGTGFSFQFGLIGKLTEEFRIGVIYDSPTWYRFDDELIQNIDSNFADTDIGYIATITNVFPSLFLSHVFRIFTTFYTFLQYGGKYLP